MEFLNKLGDIDYTSIEASKEPVIGWRGNDPIFKELIEEIKPKAIIEVGTYYGQSAINIATTCKNLGLDTKIYCVDTWLGSREHWLETTAQRGTMTNLHVKNGYPTVYYKFLSNIKANQVEDFIIPVPMASDIAWEVLKTGYGVEADLIYIDASRDYQSVYKDIINYSKILRKGGIIFGHDYGRASPTNHQGWPGVRKAVDELIKNKENSKEFLNITDSEFSVVYPMWVPHIGYPMWVCKNK